MYSTNSTTSYKPWNLHSIHADHKLHTHHFPRILSVKPGRLSANHGLFLPNTNNENHIKRAKKMRFNSANEIHQLASSGFGPPQGSNGIWDAFFTILLPFVQGIFCWGPSQLLKQLVSLNPADLAVETAEMGAEIAKDVVKKVGDTAVETVDLGTKVVKNVAGKVEDKVEKSVEQGTQVVKNVAGKVEDKAEKSVEQGTQVVKFVAGEVEGRTGETVEVGTEVVEGVVKNVEGVADGVVDQLPVDKKLKDTGKGVEDLAQGTVKDIRKIFGRGF